MRWILCRCVVALIILIATSVRSQDAIDDRGEGTVNHNYFAAAQSKILYDLLRNIEINHIDRCPHQRFQGGAMQDIAQGKYNLAREDLIYMLERFVNHPRVLQIGMMLANVSRDRAWLFERFEYAIQWYPNYAMTHAQYGLFLVESGNLAAGIERLETATKMEPNLVAGHVWLSQAYSKKGNTDLAQQSAERARKLGYQGKL
jgi:predicted Zn-dependent protease